MKSKFLPFLTDVFGSQGAEALCKAITREDVEGGSNLDQTLNAMQIVPRSLLAWVHTACGSIQDTNGQFQIPDTNAVLSVTKMGTDLYTGTFEKEGQTIHRFHTLSIPQLAAHIMTVFEMYYDSYENAQVEEIPTPLPQPESIDRTVLFRVLDMMDKMIQVKTVEPVKEEAPIEAAVAAEPELPVFDSHSYRAGYYMTLANYFRKLNNIVDAKLADEKLEEHIKSVGQFSDMNRMEFDKGAKYAVACIQKGDLVDCFQKEELEDDKKSSSDDAEIEATIDEKDKDLDLNKTELSSRCVDCGSKIVLSGKFVGCSCLDLKKGIELVKTETGCKLNFSSAWSPEAIQVFLSKLKEKGFKNVRH